MNTETHTIPENRRKQNLVLELLIILVLSITVFIFAGYYDILEGIIEFSRQYEHWELDEIITLSIFLVFALAIFSVRRWQEVQKSENSLLQHNKELQKALSEIKQLRGILPICAECKKIRDDKDCWHQVESYVRDHTEVEFSHGLCPDCVRKLYPDLSEDEVKTKRESS